ncbi:MAG: alanine racemase C-terminal domain-containing protein [Actinomycetota bacterium]
MADVPIGYGATYRTERATRVATIAAGYADGYHRAATLAKPAELGEPPTRTVAIDGRSVPVLGRISMDLIAVDVGGLRRDEVQPGTAVELLGPTCSLDQVAAANGTIANEVLTSLGQRYQRRYQGDPSAG